MGGQVKEAGLLLKQGNCKQKSSKVSSRVTSQAGKLQAEVKQGFFQGFFKVPAGFLHGGWVLQGFFKIGLVRY